MCIRDSCRTNRLPLGAAALAGTSYPLDRERVARTLGMVDEQGNPQVCQNSLDAVSDRDFAIEFAAAASLVMVHVSRLSEELILWMSQNFAFIRIADRFTTGSSIMPQKRNPDVCELVRGRTATAQAALLEALAIYAKLPSGYQRDLQLLKAPLFRGIDSVLQSCAIMTALLAGVQFARDITLDPAIHAAEEANALVVEEGIPFREAYQRVGTKRKP